MDDRGAICFDHGPACPGPEPEVALHILSAKSSGISPATLSLATPDLGAEEPLTLPATVDHSIPASLLIDSGASSQFADIDFCRKHSITLKPKPSSESLILADREASPVSQITHTCTLHLRVDLHYETLTFQVTKLAGWDLVVGKPWLHRHNPLID